ncbi:MAG: cation diffusion facilitator family transporter [Porticoccus sp.]|nr:cation diffusion facilitator family transporter [Porticoccus sp.]
MSSGADSTRSILYALIANGAIAVAKGVAAVVTNSGAMLAEAVHSLADTANQLLLLLGMKQAKRPPSPDYPLGYGKEIYFWSFIVALLLFSVGGVFSVYEGWHKLHSPEPLRSPWIAIGVLVFAVVAEGLSLLGCLKEVNKVRHGRKLWHWFRETRQSELLVVFGEDLAALLGLTFALVALSATMITGNPVYDALGSIMIGLLLIVIAILLGREVKALLVGQGVEPLVKKAMVNFLQQQSTVSNVFNVVTLQMGADVMVAVKAEMTPASSDRALIDQINLVESAFRSEFPQVMWLFFEPDVDD